MTRQDLNVFFQKLKLEPPKLEVKQCGQQYQCSLDVPDVCIDKGSMAGQTFKGPFHSLDANIDIVA